MKTVDIPGGTATLREKQDVKVRQRRLVESAALAAAPILSKLPDGVADRQALTEAEVLSLGVTRQEATSLFELQDATIVAAVASWTLDIPVPTMDTVGDLDLEVYDALTKATAELGAGITSETFEPTDPSSPGFEASPTEPSADSSSGSEGTQESGLIDGRESSGTSIDSAQPSPALHTINT